VVVVMGWVGVEMKMGVEAKPRLQLHHAAKAPKRSPLSQKQQWPEQEMLIVLELTEAPSLLQQAAKPRAAQQVAKAQQQAAKSMAAQPAAKALQQAAKAQQQAAKSMAAQQAAKSLQQAARPKLLWPAVKEQLARSARQGQQAAKGAIKEAAASAPGGECATHTLRRVYKSLGVESGRLVQVRFAGGCCCGPR